MYAFLSKMSHIGRAMKLHSKIKMKWKSGASVEGSDPPHTQHTVQHSYGVCKPPSCLSILSTAKFQTFNFFVILASALPGSSYSVCQTSFPSPTNKLPINPQKRCVQPLVHGVRPGGLVWSDLWGLSGYIRSTTLSFVDRTLPGFLVFGNWQVKLPVLTV